MNSISSKRVLVIALNLAALALGQKSKKSKTRSDRYKREDYGSHQPEGPSKVELHMQQTYEFYYTAITEPGITHIGAYVRLIFYLAVLAGSVWYLFFKDRVVLDGEKLDFNDLGIETKIVDSDGGNHKDGQDKKSKSGDTKDTAATTQQDETEATEYRHMSLKREFINKGPSYPLSADQENFTKESFAKILALQAKHVWIKYHIVRKEILENRYGLYQDRDFKKYDKMISTQVTKYVYETEVIEERAIIYLSVEKGVYKNSKKIFKHDSSFIALCQQEYEEALLETWTKRLPNKTLTKQIAIEGYAIDFMNMVKFPTVMTKSLETSLGAYLNDYYMVYDAANEDHDMQIVQLKKAIREHALETEDEHIKSLKAFKQAMLSKFQILAKASKTETEKPLTKLQHKAIKTALDKIKLRRKVTSKDDVLVFFDFLTVTAVIVCLANKFFIETCYKRKMQRRAFLTEGDMKQYTVSVKAYQRKIQDLRRLVCNAVVDTLKIEHDQWNRSAEFFNWNHVLAPQLYSIVSVVPYRHMIIKDEAYNELKKQEQYQSLADLATNKETIILATLADFKQGVIQAKDVPMILDERFTRMWDDLWLKTGFEEEEVFNDFYDHKCPFNSRYIENREQSWRSMAKKLLKKF